MQLIWETCDICGFDCIPEGKECPVPHTKKEMCLCDCKNYPHKEYCFECEENGCYDSIKD